MIRALLLTAILAGGALAAPAVRADWLVTRDGSRIETRGAWEERGRLVVFTNAKGELSSIRASELDLEASRAATEAALAPPAPPAEPTSSEAGSRSILVLTDADVEHVKEETGEGEEDGGEEAASGDLVVTSWQRSEPEDGQGVAIRGTLRNNGDAVATQVRLMVEVLDREDQVLGREEAILTSDTLGPAEALNFRVLFPEVLTIDTARFEVTNNAFNTTRTATRRPAPAAKPAVAAAPGEGEVDDGSSTDLPAEDASDEGDVQSLDDGDAQP